RPAHEGGIARAQAYPVALAGQENTTVAHEVVLGIELEGVELVVLQALWRRRRGGLARLRAGRRLEVGIDEHRVGTVRRALDVDCLPGRLRICRTEFRRI